MHLVEDDSLARLLLLLGRVLHLIEVSLALEGASHLFKIKGLGFDFASLVDSKFRL